MRQGLVSQDIAAGNASFVEVFSHEALSGALHHDLRTAIGTEETARR
jgi:hypothetical protein